MRPSWAAAAEAELGLSKSGSDHGTARIGAVAFHATSLLSPQGGIGRYARQLAQALMQLECLDLRIFSGLSWSRHLREEAVPGIESWKSAARRWVPAPYAAARAVQQLAFSLGAALQRPALYHETAFLPLRFGGPTVVTAHDLAWIRHPDTHPTERVRLLDREFPSALRRADHVITDSQFVRGEIIEHFAVDPRRITAIALGTSQAMRPRDARECEPVLVRHGLAWRSFLLSVGTIEPRKNLPLLVRAYARLPSARRARMPLVIAGMKGWLTSGFEGEAEPLARAGQLRILGHVPEDELAALYSSARALAYPSIYEGFGLPPLEAMASGTPVVVSDASSLPEVVGNAAVKFPSGDGDTLLEGIQLLLEDDREWERLRLAGIEQAGRFSWERCAAETAAVYQSLLR